jgi:large subunit ribosomal protein L15
MKLISIKSKTKKRIARGLSAGQGKTAGRGTKGQRSRSGFNLPNRFEGGQTALSMRLPKLPGFKSGHPKAMVITLDMISAAYKDGEEVSMKTLVEKKIATKLNQKIKVLNNGKLTVKVTFASDLSISKSVVAPKVAAAKKEVE